MSGHFDVRPGTNSGAGGFVEVSSADTLVFDSSVRSGVDDRTGTLLLDPKDIDISVAAGNGKSAAKDYTYSPYAAGGNEDFGTFTRNWANERAILPSTIVGILEDGTAVILEAQRDIYVSSDIEVNNTSGNGGHLQMQAGRRIHINADIDTDDGALTLEANDLTGCTGGASKCSNNRGGGAGYILMNSGATIDTGTGNFIAYVGSQDTSGYITLSGKLVIGGTSSFTTIDDDVPITVDKTTNELTGTVSFTTAGTTGNVTVVNATALDLAASTVGGALVATASAGNITDSGVLAITGAATFTVADGQSIYLNAVDATTNDANKFDNQAAGQANADDGALSFVASSGKLANVTIHDYDELFDFPALDITGNLEIEVASRNEAAQGDASSNVNIAFQQDGGFDIDGSTTIKVTSGSDKHVTLLSTDNDFTGAIGVTNGNQIKIRTKGALVLGTNEGNWANFYAGGDSTQSAGSTLTFSNFFSFDAEAGGTYYDVTLTNTGNDVDKIKNIFAKNFTYLSSRNATFSVGGNTSAGTQVTENFTVTSREEVDDWHHELIVGGTTTIIAQNEAGTTKYNIELNDADHNFATIKVTGANVTLVDQDALVLGASTVSGTYTVTAGGPITDGGALAITGAATINAGSNAVTLNDGNTFTGDLTLTSAALILGATTVGGALSVTASGAVTDTGALGITGITTISASGQTVELNEATN
ncbi:hypothetical protein M1M85_02440, partial [Nitrospinaceae bacterium]|nr:hypothetical protein [Nitrospinaceae bacterium]